MFSDLFGTLPFSATPPPDTTAPPAYQPPRLNPPPTKTAWNESVAESMVHDFEGWLKTAPTGFQTVVNQQVTMNPEPARERAILTNARWISEHEQIPYPTVIANYDRLRNSFATKNGWTDAENDDMKFHARLVPIVKQKREESFNVFGDSANTEEAQKSREASMMAAAYDAGADWNADPTKIMEGLHKWQEASKTKPWYDPTHADLYSIYWVAQAQEGRKDAEIAKTAAEGAFPILRASMEKSGQLYDVSAAVPFFRDLTPTQKHLAMKGLSDLTKKYGNPTEQMGTVEQAAQAAGRTLLKTEASLQRAWERDVYNSFDYKAGDMVPKDIAAQGPEALVAYHLKERHAPGDWVLRSNMRELSEDEAKAANAQVQKNLKDLEVRSELLNAAEGVVAPLPRETVAQKVTQGVAGAITFMAAASSGVGAITMARAYQNDFEEKAVAEGTPRPQARAMGWIVGPVQSALDHANVTLFTKFPGFKNLMGRWGATGAGAVARQGAGIAAHAGFFAGVTTVQHHVFPALVKDVGNWWDSEIPGAKWSEVKDEIWTQLPDDLMVAIPLVLMGKGFARMSDFKAADSMIRDPESLRKIGLSKEAIVALEYASPQDAPGIFMQAFKERVPVMKGDHLANSPTQAAGALAKEAKAEQKAASNVANRDRSAGDSSASTTSPEQLNGVPDEPGSGRASADLYPSDPAAVEAQKNAAAGFEYMGKDDNGWFIMQDGGKRIDVGTIEAALRMREESTLAMSAKEAQAYQDVIESLPDVDPGKTEYRLTGEVVGAARRPGGEPVVFGTRGDKAEIKPLAQADLDNLQKQMDLLGLDRATINGRNLISDGITRIEANRSREGVFTVVHEAAEAAFKAGKVSDTETRAAAAAIVPVFVADPQVGPALQRIADGAASPTEARETLMDLLVADELGQRKDGSRFNAGSLARGMTAALERGAASGIQAGLKKFRAIAQFIKAHLRALFGAMKSLQKARREGVDLSDFDTFKDKLLGFNPERRKRDNAAEKAAETVEKPAPAKPEVAESEGGASFSLSRDTRTPEEFNAYVHGLFKEGAKPSSARLFKVSGGLLDSAVARAAAMIDAVHPVKDGTVTEITHDLESLSSQYEGKEIGHDRDRITIGGPDVAQGEARAVSAILHEIGHKLDFEVFRKLYRGFGGDTEGQRRYEAVLVAARATEKTRNAERVAGKEDASQTARDAADYNAAPDEIMARAYAQYVIERAGDKGMAELLGSERGFWSPEEFKPIAKAMDGMLDYLNKGGEGKEGASFSLSRAEGESYDAWLDRLDQQKAKEVGVKPGEVTAVKIKDTDAGSWWNVVAPGAKADGSTFLLPKDATLQRAKEYALEKVQKDGASFSLSKGDSLDLLSELIESRLARNPEARVKMAEDTNRKLQKLKEKYGSVDSADAVDELRARQEYEMGAAREEKWTADQRDALELRHKREMDSLTAKQDRQDLMKDILTLDAMTAAFPAEVRGRIGGYSSLAKLTTPEARLKYLRTRVEKIAKETEKYLQKEYTGRMERLLEKAAPKREGGEKPRGKIGVEGHRFFDDIEEVMKLTNAEVDARRIALDAEYNQEGLTPEEYADIFERQQVLDTFGNFAGMDAARMAKAYERAEAVYTKGRNEARVKEEQRQQEIAGLITQTVEALGDKGRAGIQAQKVTEADLKGVLAGGSWSFDSFAVVMDKLLGRGNPLAERWSRAVREGMAARTDEVIAAGKQWKEAIESATGKTDRAARAEVFEMGNPKNQRVEVNIQPSKTSKITVPIEKFGDALADKAVADSLGLTPEDMAQLEAQFEALPPDSRKENLTLERVTKGDAQEVKHTEAEGIYLTMLWGQEGYRKAMEQAGYDAEAVASIEKQLSPAAKDLRKWMAGQYAANYAPLSKLFGKMFGVDLPQIPGYAPGLFYHKDGGSGLDITGSGQVEGGFRSSFLKERTAHTASPRAENAFQVFFGHLNQTAHWKALAETSRELRAVLGSAKVTEAIESAHGRNAALAVNKWLQSIEGNGLKQGQSALANWLYKVQANVALAWNIGTSIKQSMAVLNPLYSDLPTGAYFKGLGKALRGQLEFRAMWNSPLIQRRLLGGVNPEVRAAMGDALTSKPTLRADFIQAGMEIHGKSDAFWNTVAAAIYHDHFYQSALKDGMTEALAKRFAEDKTADMLSRTAQPVEVSDRSLFEQSLGPWGKGLFVFASEARQKSALWLNAWRRTFKGEATAQDLRVLLISHLVVGPIMAGITAALRDAKNDDDETLIDPINWQPKDFIISALAGPLQGIPLLREVVDGFEGDSGPLSRISTAAKAAGSIVKGPQASDPEEIEFYAKKISKVLMGLDSFTAVASHAGEQVFNAADNLITDSEEAAKQRKKTRNREEREAKEGSD